MMGKKGECVKPRNKVAAGFSELELSLQRNVNLPTWMLSTNIVQVSTFRTCSFPSDAGLCMAVLLHSASGL